MAPPEPHESARAMYAFHLKRLREEQGLAQPALGRKVHVSPSLISGIETCTRTPSPKLSAAFDAALGIPHFFSALQPRVVEEVGLPAGFPEYTDAESEASVNKQYENSVIPGLLQSEEYARAILSPGRRAQRVEELVGTRVARQDMLYQDDAPMLIAVIDEFALRRPFGGREVMHKQYQHMLHLASQPRVAVHVVPAEAEICPEGPFAILSFTHGPSLGYVECAGGKGQLIEAGPHLTDLEVLFELIRSSALTGAESERMIGHLMEDP